MRWIGKLALIVELLVLDDEHLLVRVAVAVLPGIGGAAREVRGLT